MSSVNSSNLSYVDSQHAVIKKNKDRTYSFLKQPFARILQAPPSFFDAPPPLKHPLNFPINLINALHQPITRLQMLRNTRDVRAEMRLLAMCH
jgi:hypothetical protein